MKTIWLLVVFVTADGQWRTWEREYMTLEACEEIRKSITHHREHQIKARCEAKVVGK